MTFVSSGKRRVWLWLFSLISGTLALLVLIAIGWSIYRYVAIEMPLQNEQHRLLNANRPAEVWLNLSINFTANGNVVLQDGRAARLAELDFSDPLEQSSLPSHVTAALKLIKATQVGYIVDWTDPDGTPVIHVWALSVNEYRGLDDGNAVEHRKGNWLLWRNLNALMAEEHFAQPNSVQSERQPLTTRVH